MVNIADIFGPEAAQAPGTPPSSADLLISHLFSSLTQPDEQLASPPPMSQGQRLAMAFAGALDPQFRKDVTLPALEEQRQAPREAQKFREQQGENRLQRGIVLAQVLAAREHAQAQLQQDRAEEDRKTREANARIKFLDARSANLKERTKQAAQGSGKVPPILTAIERQVESLRKMRDALLEPYALTPSRIPQGVKDRVEKITTSMDALQKRWDEQLRGHFPELQNEPSLFDEQQPDAEDFFGLPPVGGS